MTGQTKQLFQLIHEYPQRNLKMPEVPDRTDNGLSQDSSDHEQDILGESRVSSSMSLDTSVSSLSLNKHLVQNDQIIANHSNRNENCQENGQENEVYQNGVLKDDEYIKNDNKIDFPKIGILDVNDNYVEDKSTLLSMEDKSPECSPKLMTKITDYRNKLFSTRLFYCQTCCKSVSLEGIGIDCDSHCTHSHKMMDFMEFVNTVYRQADDVMHQAWLGLDALTEDIENARVSCNCLLNLRKEKEEISLYHFSCIFNFPCREVH